MSKAHIKSEVLKQAFVDRGLTQRGISVALGRQENHISSCLNIGKMDEDLLEKICVILGIPVSDVKKQPPEKREKPQGGVKSDPDKIISYICDLGKIQTDMLRELKELRNDIKELLAAVNTNILDGNTENHNAAENIKNFAVATNQNLNKIHNLMKYGGK